jgi:hypothetical protein
MKLPQIRSWADIQYAFDRLIKRPQDLIALDVRVVGLLATGTVFLSRAIGHTDAGIASVSHPSAGHYGITWSRPFSSGNYAAIGSAFTGASGIEHWAIDNGHTFDKTQFGFVTVDNAAFTDLSSFFIVIGPPE